MVSFTQSINETNQASETGEVNHLSRPKVTKLVPLGADTAEQSTWWEEVDHDGNVTKVGDTLAWCA